jgi:hypothetical protein
MIKITTGFRDRLNEQIEFIAKDKTAGARNFKVQILSRIKEISDRPKINPCFKRQRLIFHPPQRKQVVF